jgi:hypothetical protein
MGSSVTISMGCEILGFHAKLCVQSSGRAGGLESVAALGGINGTTPFPSQILVCSLRFGKLISRRLKMYVEIVLKIDHFFFFFFFLFTRLLHTMDVPKLFKSYMFPPFQITCRLTFSTPCLTVLLIENNLCK